MAIIISKKGKKARKIEPTKFKNEGALQGYILDNPESIPLYEIKDDLRFFIVAREFSTSSGPIDAVGIDQDGNLYFIETKLYKNPDKRQVVAQVLDYGAAIWSAYQNPQDFINSISEGIQKLYNISLEEKVRDFYELETEETKALLENIGDNVLKGNFYFMVLMDKLHDRLRDLILFLNEHSNFSIVAVELEYYKDKEQEIVIPKLFGAQVKKESRPSSSKRVRWNEESFWEDVKRNLTQAEFRSLKKVVDFAKSKADEFQWGTGLKSGSISPRFLKVCNRSFFSVFSNGELQLNICYMRNNPSAQEGLKKRLEAIGLKIPDYYKHSFVRNIPKEQWLPKVDQFIKAIYGFVRDYGH